MESKELQKEIVQKAVERVMEAHQVPARQLLAAIKKVESLTSDHSTAVSELKRISENHDSNVKDVRDAIDEHQMQALEYQSAVADLSEQVQRLTRITHLKGEPGVAPSLEEVVRALKPFLPKVQEINQQEIIAGLLPYLPKQEEHTPVEDLNKEALFDEFIARIQTERPIDVSHLKNAESFIFGKKKYKIEELMRGAGGSSTGGVTVYTETPQGLINGTNKVYTTAHSITTVIGLWYNGEFIHPGEYTALGAGFTMGTALPVISGAAFTISYV